MCNLTRTEEDRLARPKQLQALTGANLTQEDKEFFRYAHNKTAYPEQIPAAIRDAK